MKNRNGFVSNSSSSSFVIQHHQSPALVINYPTNSTCVMDWDFGEPHRRVMISLLEKYKMYTYDVCYDDDVVYDEMEYEETDS